MERLEFFEVWRAEGCEGNEGSTEDKALPILFSIAESLLHHMLPENHKQ
jgi:hypothetical protein